MDKNLHPPTKRRERRLRSGELAAYYAKLRHERPDIVLHNELPARHCDTHFLHTVLNTPRYNYEGKQEPSVVEELVRRGYDLTTLRFSILMSREGSQ